MVQSSTCTTHCKYLWESIGSVHILRNQVGGEGGLIENAYAGLLGRGEGEVGMMT